MLGALIVWWPASFWLQWTIAEGTVLTGRPAKFPTKPTEKWKKRKMYAIKQVKICAEYRDMLPRLRLDLSGTHGLRPIGLSPGSWQISVGLGSMSRYSAHILICISKVHQRTSKSVRLYIIFKKILKNNPCRAYIRCFYMCKVTITDILCHIWFFGFNFINTTHSPYCWPRSGFSHVVCLNIYTL